MKPFRPISEEQNPPPRSGGRPLHVLVVDDSAVVRQVLGTVLSQEPGIEVASAADPFIAMAKIKQRRPDVIVLDLEMPRMHGLTFLGKIMKEDPIPVVILTGHTGEGMEIAFRAIKQGAVEIMTKPKLGIKEFLYESAVILIDAVKGAAKARLSPRESRMPVAQPKFSADVILPPIPRTGKRPLGPVTTNDKIVAIGASTGGTEALESILIPMPLDAPGIAIVLHMPETFTAAYARRLNESCRITVKEAADGDLLARGLALIAPGNRHMIVIRRGHQYAVELVDGPLVSRHRPSVNVLFRSVAKAAGPNAVGVIMTGMGDDGAEGLLEMKHGGAATIAQDESTSVIFGMPKAAIDRGAVDEIAPLHEITAAIMKRASSSSSAITSIPEEHSLRKMTS
jgi:two-component system chemotaxis response regulator CheB